MTDALPQTDSQPTRPRDFLGLVLTLLVVLLWFGWPLLHPDYLGRDGDSLFLFHPAARFARSELLSGRLPLWNPYKFLGAPMLADLMIPVFYPPQLLCLLPPQPFGLHLCVVLNYLIAAGGAWFLARQGLRLGQWPAAFAALTLALGGPSVAHVTHPIQIYSMAWLPWIALAALRLGHAEARAWTAGLVLGALLGIQILAGHPQISLYSGVLLAVIFVYLVALDRRRAQRILGASAIALSVALGLAAAQLLPTLELLKYSFREARSIEFASSYQLPWRNLLTLLLPGFFGSPGAGGYRGEWNFTETAIFFGQPALLLAAASPALARGRRERWLFAGLALVGLLWALGDQTPFLRLIGTLCPPLLGFRSPARAFLLVAFAGALLAALALDRIAHAGRPGRLLVALLMLSQVAALAWFRYRHVDLPFTDLRGVELALERPHLPARRLAEGGRLFQLTTEIDYNDLSPGAVAARLRRLQPDANSLAGIPVVLGYDEGMLPLEHFVAGIRRFWRNLYTPTPDAQLMALMGIRWLVADKPVSGPQWRPVHAADGLSLFENAAWRGGLFTRADFPAVDFASLAGPYEIGPPAGEPVDILSAGRAGAASAAAGDISRPASLESTRRSPTHFDVSLRPGAPREVFLSETWMPGWRAIGPAGDVVPGECFAPFLIRFELPGQWSEFEIVYRPRSLVLGAAITGLALLLLLSAVGIEVARRSGRRPARVNSR